jgi:glycosyltransferase involved in cell wall biosynthesis
MIVYEISTVHPSNDIRIFHKIIKTLCENGVCVRQICSQSKYFEETNFKNLEVLQLKIPRSRILRILVSNFLVISHTIFTSADFYHIHDPELVFSGFLLAITGKKIVYDMHEDLPRQVFHKAWIPKILRSGLSWFLELVERLAANVFHAVIVAEPVIAKRFATHQNVFLVQNFPLKDEFDGIEHQITSNNILVYLGSIAEVRGIFEMISIVQQVNQRFNSKLLFAGNFSDERLKEKILNLPDYGQRFEYLGILDRKAVTELLTTASIGLALLHPTPKYKEAWPTKLFEYMYAQLPVLASDFPLWNDIVSDADCGFTVNPFDISRSVQLIESIFDDELLARRFGSNGRISVIKKYTWDSQIPVFLQVFGLGANHE